MSITKVLKRPIIRGFLFSFKKTGGKLPFFPVMGNTKATKSFPGTTRITTITRF